MFILLAEKFLNCGWLRGAVFQVNLKYPHVEITVSLVTYEITTLAKEFEIMTKRLGNFVFTKLN